MDLDDKVLWFRECAQPLYKKLVEDMISRQPTNMVTSNFIKD